MSDLNSVVTSQKADGSWQAVHVPSGKITHGLSAEEANNAMRELLGMDEGGKFEEPITSSRFEGDAKDIALYLALATVVQKAAKKNQCDALISLSYLTDHYPSIVTTQVTSENLRL